MCLGYVEGQRDGYAPAARAHIEYLRAGNLAFLQFTQTFRAAV